MWVKLQGTWEAARIADMLAAHAEGCVYGAPWAHNCANRIMNQIEKKKAEAKEERK